ncbi:MAG: NADH-quinone oxidoreductase subunit J [Pseudobdellovibrionaceae bacterium]
MTADAFLFWFLSIVTLISGASVVLVANPIYSSLFLAMTMVGVSALFVTLNAFFIAGVQLIVYAGAVMVLFVMVLMLFDLRHEISAFTRGKFSGLVKLATAGILSGLIVGAVLSHGNESSSAKVVLSNKDNSLQLGQLLFTKYLLGFEILGALLLIIAVGVVALARSKGGTHAKN